MPLTPIQRWFLSQEPAQPHHFNQALLLEVRQPLQPALLGQAVQHLLSHHDALRLRFARKENGWQQWLAAPSEQECFAVVDLSRLDGEGQQAALEKETARLETSLDLSTGPLLRARLL